MDSRHTKAITDCSSLHLSLYEPPHPAEVTGYRECRKNHAVRLGRLALDGCREFMPSTSWNPVGSSNIPAFLTCAACGCHRNFHRRDLRAGSIPSSPKPLSPIPTSYYVPVSASWLLHDLRNNMSSVHDPVTITPPTDNVEEREEDDNWDIEPSGTKVTRKRERTKFSKEQKEKMEAFAEKVGWTMKIAGGDEDMAMEDFCKEVGVSRGVLKNWMNNHKQRKLSPRS